MELNEQALIEYQGKVNSYSTIRDYLVNYTVNLAILSSNSIKLQTSALVQLSQSTNQLTRATLVEISNSFPSLGFCFDSS